MRVNQYTLKRVKERGYSYEGQITCSQDVYEFCKDKLALHEATKEQFLVFALDTKNKILGFTVVSIGTLDSAAVHPRDVFSFLILSNAKNFICVHNHPSGDPSPSIEDFNITHRLQEVGGLVGIDMLDHIIYTEESFYSFKKENCI